jgi:uncharacterized membrane protein
MFWGIFSNWIFLAIVSSITTAILIRASKVALGSFDSAVIMAVRVIGIGILTVPIALFVLSKSGQWHQFVEATKKSWGIMVIIAVSGAVSWYTFYRALHEAERFNYTDAAVTAINYTSVAGVLLLLMWQGNYVPGTANWIGVALVVAGAYLTSLR